MAENVAGSRYTYSLTTRRIFTRVYAITVLGSSVHATRKRKTGSVCNVIVGSVRVTIVAVDKQ